MKIGVFLHDLSGGGAEKIMAGFTNHIARHTSDEIVLILSKNNGPYLSIIDTNVNIVVLDSENFLSTLFSLYKYLRQNKIDVLYTTLINSNVISLLVCLSLSIKVVIREANTIKEYRKTRKRLGQKVALLLTKSLYRFTYKCIAISDNVKIDLVKYTNCPYNKISVIYNPIIIIDENSIPEIDRGFFNVALVSRLVKQKNINTICNIIEYFITRDLKIKFHFFGQGPDQNLLEELIVRYGTDIIELHGFNLSYYSYVKQMDLFIHIPLWEGLGNSVLEVFNSGIPMILSDVESGYSELIHEGYANVHYFHPTNCVREIIDLILAYEKGIVKRSYSRERLDLSELNTYKQYRQLAS